LDEINQKKIINKRIGKKNQASGKWPRKLEDIETKGFVIRAKKRSVKDL